MAVANNHALDCGHEGLQQTLAALEGAGISPAGGKFVARPGAGRTTVAVAGFSYLPAPHSHSILDLESAAAIVRQLKKGHHIVVVSFHGGTEGKGALYVEDREEEFLGEKRGNVMRFARAVVDAGADLVIGHGPHVLRAMEIYRGRLIAYSLGNFLVYGGFNTRGSSGITAILKVRLNGNTGEFMDGRLVPVRLDGKGIPAPDPQGSAATLIRRLAARLAHDPGLTIAEDGTIVPTTRTTQAIR
jgi:poly-gamma-glutamate capsule biosynthesis protein CapA/YwtB (metallophosphatase superfamily)